MRLSLSVGDGRLSGGLRSLHGGDTAEADIRFRALQFISQPLQNRRYDVIFPVLVATCSDTQSDYGVDLLFDIPYQANNLFGALHGNLNFDDARENLFIEDVLTNRAGGDIAHQGSDRV